MCYPNGRRVPVPAVLESDSARRDFWLWLGDVLMLDLGDEPADALNQRIAKELHTVMTMPAALEAVTTIPGAGPVKFTTADLGLIYTLTVTARAAHDPNEEAYLDIVRDAMNAELDGSNLELHPWRWSGPADESARPSPMILPLPTDQVCDLVAAWSGQRV